MQTIEEKRVYDERRGASTCLVASETGLVGVRVTGTAVGEFSLLDRRAARDVAVGPSGTDASPDRDLAPGRADGVVVAVATADDVLVGVRPRRLDGGGDASPGTDDAESTALAAALRPTGFGSAVAVDVAAGSVVAASPDGAVRTLAVDDSRSADSQWTTIGETVSPAGGPLDDSGATASRSGEASTARSTADDSPVRAIDTPFVATDRGVWRIQDGGLVDVGLTDVRDVGATGRPLAGTASGLYEAVEDGWRTLLDDPVDAVASGSGTGESDERIYAISGSSLLAIDLDDGSDVPTRRTVVTTDESLVDLVSGDGYVYAVTSTGTVVAAGPDDVRRHTIGVRDPAGIAFVDVTLSP
ncbi:HVO_0234 family beta-propeller protein [Halovivax cerinus]|uniref:HVO-0234-like beta-propeller domain-containing protein n=1 Tax=Halovivax cerinus TaxID=1487865 RepID=A0ABD5NRM1_9EURY|nr:hypothetical protein [Halovivax cerinus]